MVAHEELERKLELNRPLHKGVHSPERRRENQPTTIKRLS